MSCNNIKLSLLSCITAILLTNPTIAAESSNKTENQNQTVALRHSRNLRPFSVFDYYWNSVLDDRLSIYDSNSLKTKFITQDKQYILILEVPGCDKSQMKVKVNSNKLFITGNVEKNHKTNDWDNYLNNNFNYVVSLYEDIDQKNIASNLKNGILTITLPRMELREQIQEKYQFNKRIE